MILPTIEDLVAREQEILEQLGSERDGMRELFEEEHDRLVAAGETVSAHAVAVAVFNRLADLFGVPEPESTNRDMAIAYLERIAAPIDRWPAAKRVD
jgi:hypothetical protein